MGAVRMPRDLEKQGAGRMMWVSTEKGFDFPTRCQAGALGAWVTRGHRCLLGSGDACMNAELLSTSQNRGREVKWLKNLHLLPWPGTSIAPRSCRRVLLRQQGSGMEAQICSRPRGAAHQGSRNSKLAYLERI